MGLVRFTTDAHKVLHIPDKTMEKNIVLQPNNWSKFDPFLMMAEDKFRAPGGFTMHPHRGFEAVSVVLAGQQRHTDSRGNTGVLSAGDVQWMTAGSGVVHSEMPDGPDTVHSMQLWLNLPRAQKMTPAQYQDIRAADIPVWEAPGVQVRVASGESHGVQGPARNIGVQVKMLDVHMTQAGAVLQEDIPAAHNLFAYVLKGRAAFGADQRHVSAGHVVLSAPVAADASVASPSSSFQITALSSDVHFLLFSGTPIQEPVVQQGPFVGNSMEDIRQAHRDYSNGTLC